MQKPARHSTDAARARTSRASSLSLGTNGTLCTFPIARRAAPSTCGCNRPVADDRPAMSREWRECGGGQGMWILAIDATYREERSDCMIGPLGWRVSESTHRSRAPPGRRSGGQPHAAWREPPNPSARSSVNACAPCSLLPRFSLLTTKGAVCGSREVPTALVEIDANRVPPALGRTRRIVAMAARNALLRLQPSLQGAEQQLRALILAASRVS